MRGGGNGWGLGWGGEPLLLRECGGEGYGGGRWGGKSVTGGSCRTSERAEHVFPSGSWRLPLPPPPWVGADWEERFVPFAWPADTGAEAGRDPGRAWGLERQLAPGLEGGGGGSEFANGRWRQQRVSVTVSRW